MNIHTTAAFAATKTYDEKQLLTLELLASLNQAKISGQDITAEDIAMLCDGQDNSQIRAWVKNNTGIAADELRKALRNVRIKAELGTVPSCASDLVMAVVKRDKMACYYDGMIKRTVIPWMDDDKGDRMFIDPVSLKNSPELQSYVKMHFPTQLNRIDFAEELRMISDRLKLGLSERSIEDALSSWYKNSKRVRRFTLYSEVAGPLPTITLRESVEQIWLDVATKLFETNDTMTPEFVVAVLKKFIWQVKRKVYDLEVTDHLMPVLLGQQGKGKSTFVMKMLAPMIELMKSVHFGMI